MRGTHLTYIDAPPKKAALVPLTSLMAIGTQENLPLLDELGGSHFRGNRLLFLGETPPISINQADERQMVCRDESDLKPECTNAPGHVDGSGFHLSGWNPSPPPLPTRSSTSVECQMAMVQN